MFGGGFFFTHFDNKCKTTHESLLYGLEISAGTYLPPAIILLGTLPCAYQEVIDFRFLFLKSLLLCSCSMSLGSCFLMKRYKPEIFWLSRILAAVTCAGIVFQVANNMGKVVDSSLLKRLFPSSSSSNSLMIFEGTKLILMNLLSVPVFLLLGLRS